MKNKPDNALVELAKQGERRAFDALCVRHCPKLVGYLVRRYGRSEYSQDIEDVVQETLLLAWTHIAKFRGDSQFSTWLCTIGRNAFLNHVARERRHSVPASKRVEIDAVGGISNDDTINMSDATTAEQSLDGKQQALILYKQLSSLPRKLQGAFFLRVFDQLSYEEIGQELNIPINTVRSRIRRAREQTGRL